jgi:hypothetical protein
MKPVLFLSAISLLFIPSMHGQTFAVTQLSNKETSVINTCNYTAFAPHRGYKPGNKKIIWGGITAATGGVASVFGMLCYSFAQGDGEDGPPNGSLENTGKAFLAGGVALAATGFILMITGRTENNRYGLQIVAPGKNELGIAYNF